MSTKEITDLGWREIMNDTFLIELGVKDGIDLSFILSYNLDDKTQRNLAVIADSYSRIFFDGYLRNIDDLKLIMELTGINEIIENAKKSK